mgnify:CR=1 FL=1
MPEYIHKQAVLNLIDEFEYNSKANTWGVTKDGVVVLKPDTLDKLHEAVKAMPAEDVVKIVRCQDCAGKKACDLWGIYLDDDDFCNHGR